MMGTPLRIKELRHISSNETRQIRDVAWKVPKYGPSQSAQRALRMVGPPGLEPGLQV